MEKDLKNIALFEKDPVRRVWDKEKEKWYFSVVDVVRVLTGSQDARNYWKVLKNRLIGEGSNQTVTNCNQLKFLASDGKMRETDAADVETLLRLIQSIPSPKAEPFKLWLAKVGYERMQETIDPELTISRARRNWQMRGHSSKWIEQRMLSVETRNNELSTRHIAESTEAEGYKPNEGAAHEGGQISGNARRALERKIGKKIVNPKNFLLGEVGRK